MFAGYDETTKKDDIVYMAVNPYWESIKISLPPLPKGLKWKLAVDTADYTKGKFIYEDAKMRMVGKDFLLGSRSVAIFVAK